MQGFSQGDLIRIHGFRNLFLIVSKNAFIRAVHMFHVCPVITEIPDGPLHIPVTGMQQTQGVVICEQMKLIDPLVRPCTRVDRILYGDLMDISDVLQGIFEYD